MGYTSHDLYWPYLTRKREPKYFTFPPLKLQVNQALLELIEASEVKKMKPSVWTNMPKKSSGKYHISNTELSTFFAIMCWYVLFFPAGWIGTRMALMRINTESGSNASLVFYYLLSKLQLCVLYLFGLFVLVFEYGRRVITSCKPARVGTSLTLENSQWTTIVSSYW